MKPIVFDGKLYSPCECALARPMAEQIARLVAEVETLKRERDGALAMLEALKQQIDRDAMERLASRERR